MHDSNIEFPVRINRYLFLKGYCSRRKADELIQDGQVKINGENAVLGQKVGENDKVELTTKIKEMPKNYEYHLFYKPRGVVSHNPQEGEKAVEDFFKNANSKKLAPVGRLDKDSEGLMFITNDGRIIDKMLNPKYEHEKEYVVKVDKPLKESFENKMSKGVRIEEYMTKPAKVRTMSERTFNIVLTEGKKHQIRRMCAALGYQVKDLKRVRIMGLRLSGLYPGQSRSLKIDEKIKLLKSIGL
jgi:23S rRNA pseudouridine2604 synthase